MAPREIEPPDFNPDPDYDAQEAEIAAHIADAPDPDPTYNPGPAESSILRVADEGPAPSLVFRSRCDYSSQYISQLGGELVDVGWLRRDVTYRPSPDGTGEVAEMDGYYASNAPEDYPARWHWKLIQPQADGTVLDPEPTSDGPMRYRAILPDDGEGFDDADPTSPDVIGPEDTHVEMFVVPCEPEGIDTERRTHRVRTYNIAVRAAPDDSVFDAADWHGFEWEYITAAWQIPARVRFYARLPVAGDEGVVENVHRNDVPPIPDDLPDAK